MEVGEYMYFNAKISEGFRDLFFFLMNQHNSNNSDKDRTY